MATLNWNINGSKVLLWKKPTRKNKKNIFVKSFVPLGFSVSNWQKVQLNTDLFSDTQKYLYAKQEAWLKLNEIGSLI